MYTGLGHEFGPNGGCFFSISICGEIYVPLQCFWIGLIYHERKGIQSYPHKHELDT